MSNTIDWVILFLKHNLYVFAILVFIGSFISVNLFIPRVLYVAYQKKLTAPIIARSSHSRMIPSLGGVAFFMAIVIFISLIEIILHDSVGYNIIAAIGILFMVGLKDDLVNSSARVKLYGQLMASLFIVFSSEFRIRTLHGFLGIHEIHPVVSVLVAILFLTFIINAYNLIDGIDGLASMIGIIICSTFMFLYYIKEDYFFFLLCALTIGVLIAFLRFNLSSGRMKIFMGDCGSLVIGLIIGACTLHYLSTEPLGVAKRFFYPQNRILFVTAVLFVPLFDTVRIIIIRIITGRSPFEADRNHLHHILIDSGISHARSSMLIGCINLIVIFIFFSISNNLDNLVVGTIMFSLYLLIAFGFHRRKLRNLSKLERSINI